MIKIKKIGQYSPYIYGEFFILKLIKSFCFLLLIIICFFAFYFINVPKIDLAYSVESAEVYFSGGSASKIVSVNPKTINYYIGKKGEAYEISEKVSEKEILKKLNAIKVFEEKTEFGKSIYAYSKNIDYSAEMYGKKINVHLHFSSSKSKKIKIGFPLIYGSF